MKYLSIILLILMRSDAREEGKSDEEAAVITKPVHAYEFVAEGVLIEE
jgi:hypothetical protein